MHGMCGFSKQHFLEDLTLQIQQIPMHNLCNLLLYNVSNYDENAIIPPV